MTISLNGTDVDVSGVRTLAELIEQRTGTTRGSAVVVDDVVVPRAEWAAFPITDGQRIELITAVQGG